MRPAARLPERAISRARRALELQVAACAIELITPACERDDAT